MLVARHPFPSALAWRRALTSRGLLVPDWPTPVLSHHIGKGAPPPSVVACMSQKVSPCYCADAAASQTDASGSTEGTSGTDTNAEHAGMCTPSNGGEVKPLRSAGARPRHLHADKKRKPAVSSFPTRLMQIFMRKPSHGKTKVRPSANGSSASRARSQSEKVWRRLSLQRVTGPMRGTTASALDPLAKVRRRLFSPSRMIRHIRHVLSQCWGACNTAFGRS